MDKLAKADFYFIGQSLTWFLNFPNPKGTRFFVKESLEDLI